MDSLSFSVPYEYVSSKTSLTWQEVLYALERRIFTLGSVLEYSFEILRKTDQHDDLLIELAYADDEVEAKTKIEEILVLNKIAPVQGIEDKWLYIVLSWLYQNRDKYEDPLQEVEVIYSFFDYPEEITSFVRYMPTNHPTSGDSKENIEALYDCWEKYLVECGAKY